MTRAEPLCIQWKRAAAARWYERVKDMSEEELLAFYEELNRKYIPGYVAPKTDRDAGSEKPATKSPQPTTSNK